MAKSALFSVPKNEPCPQCGAGFIIRSGKHGPFLGCSHYPKCQFVINFKPVAGICSECQYPLLIDKKTAQGVKRFCANKLCGKPAMLEQASE